MGAHDELNLFEHSAINHWRQSRVRACVCDAPLICTHYALTLGCAQTRDCPTICGPFAFECANELLIARESFFYFFFGELACVAAVTRVCAFCLVVVGILWPAGRRTRTTPQ